jgi:hypothetical protein
MAMIFIPSMLKLEPKFIAMTGDVVYYDNDAPQRQDAGARPLHWERMFSLPRLIETLRNTGTYWLKDDHDTLKNDTAGRGTNMACCRLPRGRKSFVSRRRCPEKVIARSAGAAICRSG